MLHTILLYIWGLVNSQGQQKNNFLLFFCDEDTEYQELEYSFELGVYDVVICLDNTIPFLYTFYIHNLESKMSLQSVYKGGNLENFIEIDKLLKIRFVNDKLYMLYPKDAILDVTFTKK
jgi:hypothetical protein